MRLNNKSIQGLFLYSPDVEYERGDFVVSGDCIYICTAVLPTSSNTSNPVVSGIDPKFDTTGNFKVYPGDKIFTAQEYYDYVNNIQSWEFCNTLSEVANNLGVNIQALQNIGEVDTRDNLPSVNDITDSINSRIYKILSENEYAYVPYREDKFISGNVLNQILQDSFFGVGENGIIKDSIYANIDEEGNIIPEYSLGGTIIEDDNDRSILDAIMRSPDLNNGMLNIDRSLVRNIISNDNPVTSSILLKQYTYIDIGNNNSTVRIQELIDPDAGCVCYRYALGTLIESTLYDPEQSYQRGQVIRINEQNSNRIVTWIAKSNVQGHSPYDSDGGDYWKQFRGNYTYQTLENDWKIDNTTSNTLVEQVRKIKAYYELKLRELEETREQLTDTFCNREVTDLRQESGGTVELDSATLVAGENIRLHKTWEYINSNEDQVLEALGVSSILDACTIFPTTAYLNPINPSVIGVNLIVRIGTPSNYTYRYCLAGSQVWTEVTTENELRTAFGLTNSQKLSDIFYVSSETYENLLSMSPDFPLTVIIKDSSTGSLSVAVYSDIYNTVSGQTYLKTADPLNQLTEVYIEDLVYNNTCLGCDPTNTAFPELGGYIGLRTDDENYHIPVPMLYSVDYKNLLIKSSLGYPIYDGIYRCVEQSSLDVYSCGGITKEMGERGVIFDPGNQTLGSSSGFRYGDVVVDAYSRKRYVCVSDNTYPEYNLNYVQNNFKTRFISLTELFDEAPFSAYYNRFNSPYVSTRNYIQGNIVIYNNNYYKAKQSCVGQTPSGSSIYWENIGLQKTKVTLGERGNVALLFNIPYSDPDSIWNNLVIGPNRLIKEDIDNSNFNHYFPKYSYTINDNNGVMYYSMRNGYGYNNNYRNWQSLRLEQDSKLKFDHILNSRVNKYFRYDGSNWVSISIASVSGSVRNTDDNGDLLIFTSNETDSSIINRLNNLIQRSEQDEIVRVTLDRNSQVTTFRLDSNDIVVNTNSNVSGFFAIIYADITKESAYYTYFDIPNEEIKIKCCYDNYGNLSEGNLTNFLQTVFNYLLSGSSFSLDNNETYNRIIGTLNRFLPSSTAPSEKIVLQNCHAYYNLSTGQCRNFIKLTYKSIEDGSGGGYWYWDGVQLNTVTRFSSNSQDLYTVFNEGRYDDYINNQNNTRKKIGFTVLKVSDICGYSINKIYILKDISGCDNNERLNNFVYFSQQNPKYKWKEISPDFELRIADYRYYTGEKVDPWEESGTYRCYDSVVYHKNAIWRRIDEGPNTENEEPGPDALSWEYVDQDTPRPENICNADDHKTYIWTNDFSGTLRFFPDGRVGSSINSLEFQSGSTLVRYFHDEIYILNENNQRYSTGQSLDKGSIFSSPAILNSYPITELEDTRRKAIIKNLGYTFSEYLSDQNNRILISRFLNETEYYKNIVLKSMRPEITYVVNINDTYIKIPAVGNESDVSSDINNNNDYYYIKQLTSPIIGSSLGLNYIEKFYTPFLIYRKYSSNYSTISDSTDFYLGFTNNQQRAVINPVNNSWVSGFGSLLKLLLDNLSDGDVDNIHSVLEFISKFDSPEVFGNIPPLPIRTVCKASAISSEVSYYRINGNFWVYNGTGATGATGLSDYSLLSNDNYPSNPSNLPDAFGLGKYKYKYSIGGTDHWWFVYQNPGWFDVKLDSSGKLIFPQAPGTSGSGIPRKPAWGESYDSVEEALYNILNTNLYFNNIGEVKGILYDPTYTYKIGDIVIDTEEFDGNRTVQRMWRCKQNCTGQKPSSSPDFWDFYDDPLYHTFTKLQDQSYLCDPSVPIKLITKVSLSNFDYYLALNTDANDFSSYSIIITILIQNNSYSVYGGEQVRRTYVLTIDLSELGDNDEPVNYYVTDDVILTVSGGEGEDVNTTRILNLNDSDYIIKNIYYRYKL